MENRAVHAFPSLFIFIFRSQLVSHAHIPGVAWL